MPEPQVPGDVRSWLHTVFRSCNERITAKLSNQPNAPEQSFDLTWIEHLSQYASPVAFGSTWTAKIETHYLGGLRQFYDWEIADIGVLLFVKRSGVLERAKVALLQSKRLYPSNMKVSEESKSDYQIGIARLADPEILAQSIGVETDFEFTDSCRYGAIIPGSEQVQAISEYEKQSDLRVYYQLYNPWRVPFSQRIPLQSYAVPSGEMTLGVRIAPASAIHGLLAGAKSNRPRLRDLGGSEAIPMGFGWPLESFIADEFLACREGNRFGSPNEGHIQNLFYRRSGPISAAIAITLEAPPAVA